MNNGWQHLANPYGNGIKIYLNEIIGSNGVARNEDILERISRVIVTENDYKQFGKLVATIYESAHIKAMEQISQYRDVLERHGLRIGITTDVVKPGVEKIFKDQDENSG
jgi:deoxyhypusine synthase